MKAALDKFEEEFPDSDFLEGAESFTMADVFVWPFLHFMAALEGSAMHDVFEEASLWTHPKTFAWYKRCLSNFEGALCDIVIGVNHMNK